jgi:oligosaccharide repeat unit polymerase
VLFDPRLIFALIWLTQVAGHVFLTDVFNPIGSTTWLAVYVAVASFLCGAQSVVLLKGSGLVAASADNDDRDSGFAAWVSRIAPYALIGFSVIVVFTFSTMLGRLGLAGLQPGSYELLREALIYDFKDQRTTAVLIKVFFAVVGVAIFFLCYSRTLPRIYRAAFFLLGLGAALMTTGRLALLLLFLAASYIMYSLKVIQWRGVVVSFATFIVVFLAVAVVFKKGGENSTVFGQLIWNIQVYLLGSLSLFDFFVTNHEPIISGGTLLPNFIRTFLSHFGGEIPLKPAVYPFVANPLVSNVYTAIFPVFHDVGFAGVTAFFSGLGVLHQLLFYKQQGGQPLYRYLYALSLYPLIMTIFEEAYLSSLGFWLTLLIVPVFFRSAYYVHSLLYKYVRLVSHRVDLNI